MKSRTCHFQCISCVQCLCSTVYCRISITNKNQSNLAPQHCHHLQLHSCLKTQNACHYGKLHTHKCADKRMVFGTEWIAELLHLHLESVCTVFTRCTVFTSACFYRASVFYRVHSFYRVHAFKGLVVFTGCTRSVLGVVVYLKLYLITWKQNDFCIQTFVSCKPWKLPKDRSLVHVGFSEQLQKTEPSCLCCLAERSMWRNVPNQVVMKYNFNFTTLLPSLNTVAQGMFCDARYTHHTFTPIIKHQ